MNGRGHIAHHPSGPLAAAGVWPPPPQPPDSQGRSDLTRRIWFTLAALAIFRIGTYIPLPGVEAEALALVMEHQRGSLVGILHLFTGGAFSRMTIFALGIMPFLLSAVLMSLLTVVSPALEGLKKRDEAGRRKIVWLTRIGAMLLAALFGYIIAVGIEATAVMQDPGLLFRATRALTLAAGTVFLMWLADQITGRGIGDGVLLIILAGIVADLPAALAGAFEMDRQGAVPISLLMALMVGVLIVFVERAQRRVVVQYPERTVGGKTYGGEASFIPMKINTAGAVPIIHVSAILFLPFGVIEFATHQSEHWIAALLGRGQPLFLALYAVLTTLLAFVAAFKAFNPADTARNLNSYGGFIPGVRPGANTEAYLRDILIRLTCVGAVYLLGITVLSEILISRYSLPFFLSGMVFLILIRGTMDVVAQIQYLMLGYRYERLIKK